MKTKNIISAYQSVLAIENAKIDTANIDKILDLSSHEARTLAQFCNMLMQHNLSFDIFDGYYISYSIKQISKEFDLLRFSNELVINIELKSELELDVLKKMKKINSQMDQNHYYLTSIGKNVLIYTYVENDGLYKYNTTTRNAFKIEFSELIAHLSAQIVNYNFDPDKLFVPSNYLISPFNSTQRFINDEYFLNGTQQNIKKVILKSINNSKQNSFAYLQMRGQEKPCLCMILQNR